MIIGNRTGSASPAQTFPVSPTYPVSDFSLSIHILVSNHLDGSIMREWLVRLIQLKFRKRRRHKARTGLFVTFDNTLSRNQIGDINMRGLSYYYEDHGFSM